MQYASQPWGMPTQQWVAPPPPNQLWKQGWRNPTIGGPQQPMTQPPMQLLPPPQMQASTSTPPQPQLPAQPIPNPNNGRPGQPTQVVGLATYPTYSISSLDCNDIHLRSRKTLTKDQPHISIEYLNEEVPNEESEQKQSQEPSKAQNSHPELQDPPYPERLNQEKPFTQPEFDFLGELKNVCVKIPLFQAIKDVPIYSKVVRELCLRKPGRK
jgi:hypothetical protein